MYFVVYIVGLFGYLGFYYVWGGGGLCDGIFDFFDIFIFEMYIIFGSMFVYLSIYLFIIIFSLLWFG